ncbi:hypothetical protein SLEP1_g56662 [Rubroshorea leprosula]|uniref:Uncharacterized protein n=1 Tax=Rubroshorea leprosula TaxID=152421 RepID=A0AAV5MIZ9_9ROSI|nr:hypothetical protein SLEP1_g56662 [Rubroshorea leprosula]
MQGANCKDQKYDDQLARNPGVRDQDCYSAINQSCTKGQKPDTEDAVDAPLKVPAPCKECRPLAR